MEVIFGRHFVKESKKLRKKFKFVDRDILGFVDNVESGKMISATRIQHFGDL